MQKRAWISENKVLDNFVKKKRLKIFYITGILVMLVVVSLILIFLFVKYLNPEKQLNLSADIEDVFISENGKTSYIKLSGGSNAEEITEVKFILKDGVVKL